MSKLENTATNDPVVEIREIRDQHAKKFDFDVSKMFADVREFALEQNLKTVSPPANPNSKKTGS